MFSVESLFNVLQACLTGECFLVFSRFFISCRIYFFLILISACEFTYESNCLTGVNENFFKKAALCTSSKYY